MSDQVIISIIMSWAIEKLKYSRWFPLLSYFHSPQYKVIFSGVMALVATFGFHYTFESSTRHLILTIPTQAEFMHDMWEFIRQFVFQHAAYMTFIKKQFAIENGINVPAGV